jgi:hypothetical protein
MQRFTTTPTNPEKQLQLGDIQQKISEALALADKIEAGDATIAEQRQGLVMALRGVCRIARYLAT